jgi:DNA-binding transcriptional MocR family regulator
MELLPDVQIALRPGLIEFGWGHPDPALLPVAPIGRAAAHALARSGRDALAYGADQGPGHLIELLRQRLGRLEGHTPPAEQLMITGGNSQAIDLLCGQLARPGDVALVEAPTYHLALRILHDRGLRAVAVPGDADGLDVAAAAAALRDLRARGERVALLYLVPNFGNPSGATLPAARRRALAELALAEGLAVIEDDAYGELWYESPPPPSLFSLAPDGPVARIGSYAKVLAPGLRLGWMLASPELVRRCAGCGLLDSGGGVNHFTAHVVGALLELELLDPHVAGLRAALRGRRDALLAALARHMPPGCSWGPAPGGFFLWLGLPEGLDSMALLPAAEAAGVSYLPGPRFFAGGGGQRQLRLSFSLLPPEQLEEGARRLGAVLARAASVLY